MATLPSANTSVNAEAGPLAGGTGYCVIVAPVATNADAKPRVFSSFRALLAQHDYSPGADYAALHIARTRQQVLFCGIPIATAGVVSRQDGSGVTGSSVISVAAGASGSMEETDGSVTVAAAGTVGTNGISVDLSLDGGRTSKRIRLGTANSYVIPYVGLTISFGGGTLNVGDVYRFASSAPMFDADGIDAARAALSTQQKPARSWIVIGDLPNATVAGFVTSAINTYETSKKRFSYARVQVRDRLPLAAMSRTTVRMTGTPTLTFAEVGATGDTITRSAGSWLADGFAVGMYFTVSGSGSNNVSDKIAALTDTVMTLGSTDLAAEVGTAGCTVVASPALTFAEVGGTGDTITRSGGGSFLAEGFAVGDTVTVAGSASNNVSGPLTAVTATVLTFGTTDLAAEVIGSRSVTIIKGETMAAWVSAMDSAFASVDGQKRVDIGLGRGRIISPITNWFLRRPAAWHASIREYQHDVHITNWRKEDGPLLDVSLTDADGSIVEFDEDNDGGGLAGRFTCLRTWGNGPLGAFVAMSLTRDTEGSLLSYTHNLAVANVACTVIQQATENIVGKTLQLNDDGTATQQELSALEAKANTDLAIALLQQHVAGEGPRASKAVWTANKTDNLAVVNATLTGVCELHLNGTIVHVDTIVNVL